MRIRLIVAACAAFAAVSAMAATIDVKGAVVKPGAVQLTEGMRLRQAVDAAGGLAGNADPMAITVIRESGNRLAVDLSKPGPTPLLSKGDVIEVPVFDPEKYVMVAGAVAKPGAIPYKDGITVGEVLSSAQPFDEVSVGTVRIVGKNGVKGLPQGVTEADLYAMTLAPGEAVKVNYAGQAFSNRELLIIIAVIVLILVLK